MKHHVIPVFLFGALVFALTGQCNAQDTAAEIQKLLQFPMRNHQGSCLKSIISQDAAGKELFATEKCPFIENATLDIEPETETSEASKGSIKITMQCTIKNNDYYAGKPSKSFEQGKTATITADYMYALNELSLKNVSLNGDQFCGHPVMKRIKPFQ